MRIHLAIVSAFACAIAFCATAQAADTGRLELCNPDPSCVGVDVPPEVAAVVAGSSLLYDAGGQVCLIPEQNVPVGDATVTLCRFESTTGGDVRHPQGTATRTVVGVTSGGKTYALGSHHDFSGSPFGDRTTNHVGLSETENGTSSRTGLKFSYVDDFFD